MSHWCTESVKFQTAYSQKLIQLGLSIILVRDVAVETDSHVVNFERAVRELPSADLSITLPIVVVALCIDSATHICDISECQFKGIKEITGKGKFANPRKIVEAFLRGEPMRAVGPGSPEGPAIPSPEEDDDDDANEA